MSRANWVLVKQSKRFYANTYRMASKVLILSLIVNLCLGILIYYTYFNKPSRDYYATSGITPPVQLTPMEQANITDVPLLAEEQQVNSDTKVIPQ